MEKTYRSSHPRGNISRRRGDALRVPPIESPPFTHWATPPTPPPQPPHPITERETLPDQVPKSRHTENDPFNLSPEQIGDMFEVRNRQSDRSRRRGRPQHIPAKPEKRIRPTPKSPRREREHRKNPQTQNPKDKVKQNRRIRRKSPSKPHPRLSRRDRSRSRPKKTHPNSRSPVSSTRDYTPGREEKGPPT